MPRSGAVSVTRAEVLECIRELRAEIGALRREVSTTRDATLRLEVLVCGDGSQGIGERITSIEQTISNWTESMLPRLAVIEHQLARADRLQWLIIATLVAILVEKIVSILTGG